MVTRVRLVSLRILSAASVTRAVVVPSMFARSRMLMSPPLSDVSRLGGLLIGRKQLHPTLPPRFPPVWMPPVNVPVIGALTWIDGWNCETVIVGLASAKLPRTSTLGMLGVTILMAVVLTGRMQLELSVAAPGGSCSTRRLLLFSAT